MRVKGCWSWRVGFLMLAISIEIGVYVCVGGEVDESVEFSLWVRRSDEVDCFVQSTVKSAVVRKHSPDRFG